MCERAKREGQKRGRKGGNKRENFYEEVWWLGRALIELYITYILRAWVAAR